MDVTIPGQIVDNDPKDAVRQMPSKVHVLKLEQGKGYLLDLVSDDFDSYLRVEDSAGKTVGQDDDGGQGLNARLKFLPDKSDTFKIIATTFAGGTGNYTLTVKEQGGGGNPAKKAQPVGGALPEAVKIDAPTAKKATELQGQLQNGDPQDAELKGPARVYAVELGEGIAYQFDLMSADFDSYLRITDAQGKELARDDDGGGNLNSRLVFVAPAKGTYKVVTTSLGAGTGAYQFSITEKGKAAKVDPNKIFDIDKGLLIAGELTANDAKDKIQMMSHCHVHQIKMQANKTYVIDLMSGKTDSYLRIEDAKGNNLAEDDDGGDGLNSRLVFRATENATYRIVTTTLQGGTGGYTLTVREE